MPLFEEDIKDKQELEKWRKQLGIKVNPNVRIRNTKDRGVGVFYTPGKQPESESNERIELVRIPHMSSYNIYTLKTMVDEDLDEEDRAVVKKTLNVIFSKSRGSSESLILIAYCIAFLLLCKKRKVEKVGGKGSEFKARLGTYMSVLLGTTVGNLYGDHHDVLTDFLDEFPGNVVLKNSIVDITGGLWADVTETLNEEFSEKYDAIEEEDVLQICGAVRSRVLEIPREVEGEDGEDDYYVDVTLIPILDYVNHDNERRNAHFDVDRTSLDVVLYLEKPKQEREKEMEVYISYDRYEDLHRMFVNYGFFPRNATRAAVIEIPILGYCGDSKLLGDYEMTRRLYCLRQTPNVQFKVFFDAAGGVREMKVVTAEFYSYLVFKDDVAWDEFEREDDEAMNELNERGEDDAEELQAEMETNFLRGFVRSEELVAKLDKQETGLLLNKFCEYVGEFFAKMAQRCRRFAEIVGEYELAQREGTNVLQVLALYEALSGYVGGLSDRSKLLSQGEDSHDDDDDDDDDDNDELQGFLATRMVPVYNFAAAVDGVEVGELEIA